MIVVGGRCASEISAHKVEIPNPLRSINEAGDFSARCEHVSSQ